MTKEIAVAVGRAAGARGVAVVVEARSGFTVVANL